MSSFLYQLCANDQGQDIAEYAVMLAVILVIVVGTIRLIAGRLLCKVAIPGKYIGVAKDEEWSQARPFGTQF